MAIAFKNFIIRLFRPLLSFMDIPYNYPIDPDKFGKFEFPPRTFPLSVASIYLPLVVGLHQVTEIGRYKLGKEGEHQVVMARVEVEKEVWKLLRIERDTVRGVLRVGEKCIPKGNRERLKPTNVKLEGSGSSLPESGASSDTTCFQAPLTPKSPHPSISIHSLPAISYNSNIYEDPTETKDEEKDTHKETPIDVDTVQSVFSADLQKLVCVESIQPREFYLHHLAILVDEVHQYNCVNPWPASQSDNGDEHRCTLFADLLMRVVEKEIGIPPVGLEEVGPITSPVALNYSDATSKEDPVSQILEGYRRKKGDVEKRRKMRDLVFVNSVEV
ncbi:hypothetical protein CPB84DRAFT_1767431 [Gymnopilus junonius]|uniref:Uncharacterized protein n=1 Tax=Gymnopilus junonius TaxID=109634 RepID=A0A9P5TS77_GYMJU|nr:hypothetical protein CPB84DRAFT_1767431 [Gymnopilus junonius]